MTNFGKERRLAPIWLASILTIITLFISGQTLLQITHQPWLGINFDIKDTSSQTGLLIKSAAKDSPAAGKVQQGLRILSLSSAKHSPLPVSNKLFQQPLSQRTLHEYRDYIDYHENIAAILSEPLVNLHLEGKDLIQLKPDKTFPISAIPTSTAIFFISNLIGLIVGAIIWFRYPAEKVSILVLLMGIAYYGHSTTSLLAVREIALTGLHEISIAANFFSILFGLSLVALLISYPNKIYPLTYVIPITLSSSFLVINATVGFFDVPLHTFYFQFILFYPFVFFFAWKQWQSSTPDPLKKAACQAFLLFIFIFVVGAVSLFIVPMVLSLPPLLDENAAILLMGSIFIGFAIGILQYRLFNVEKWWFKTWLWLISGLLIIILDLVLVYALGLSQSAAVGIAIVLIGFVYFPVRQWLFQRLLPISEKPVEDYFPAFMQSIKDGIYASGFENSWRNVLSKRYRPMNIEYKNGDESVNLIENGLSITVPATRGDKHYCLTGKSGGIRLFNKKDRHDIAALHSLIQQIDQTSQKRHELIMHERQKIMQDMHDTVGADLLTLSHRTDDPASKEHIRNTLQILRDTVRLSRSGAESLSLEKLLADWRSEVVERCELADIELEWLVEDTVLANKLTVTQAVMLQQVLREAVTNAIKHAQPDLVKIEFRIEQNNLQLIVNNDGSVSDPGQWIEGNGLSSIRSRLNKLNSAFSFTQNEGLVTFKVCLPL